MRTNRFFSPDMLDVLLDHRRWHIISGLIRREVSPVKDPRHAAWMTAHSHSHSHTEVMFVLGGHGHMGYETQVYPFEPGTIFCFGPNETHDLERPDWAPEAEMLWITLLGRKFLARITSFRRDLPQGKGCLGHLVMAENSGRVAADPLAKMLGGGALRSEVRNLQVHAGVQLLIGAVIDRGDDPEDYRDEPIQRQVVRMIQEHLEETGGRGLSPAEIARMSGYSKSYFMRLFRRLTGETLQESLDRCRWRRALELEKKGWRQYQIAEDLGFSGAASFSRWLRQQRAADGD